MRKSPPVLTVLIALAGLFLAPFPAPASTYVDVGDEVYQGLARLEAEGLVPSALLSTKPVGRREAVRLVKEAESKLTEESSAFLRELIRSLKERLNSDALEQEPGKSYHSVYAGLIHTGSDIQRLNFNNDGDIYARGYNLRAGARSRLEDAGPFSLALNPEYRSSEEDDEIVLKKGYIVLGLSKLDVIAGKDSQWWGPGYHGSILLSNNAEPFTMARLTNPTPVVLPWIFKYLGNFRFTFFATNLEKGREIPEPYLWGMRFDFKPLENLEIGLQRTAILGGRNGRPDDLWTWTKSIFPFFRSDNTGTLEDPGDQRAGFDVKWTIPSSRQPVQVYVEGDGEDMHILWPNLWAWVGGVYLPGIGGLERLDFRAEIGTTMGRRLSPTVWYSHWLYKSGYTYKGRIIGHHIGTDSRDMFAEISYHIPEKSGRLFFWYDREEHNLRGAGSSEIDHEITAGADIGLSKNIQLTASYGHGWIRNFGNLAHEVQQVSMVAAQVRYDFY